MVSTTPARPWAFQLIKVWLPQGGQTFLALLGSLSLLAGSGCRENEASGDTKPAVEAPAGAAAALAALPPPVTGIRTALRDTVANLPGGQIAWSTYWQLCWAPYAGAQAYELQVSTAEGTSPKLRRRLDSCFRLQVATGQNAKAQGLLDRERLLDLQAGQLSFRVRAVLGPAAFSEWSPASVVLAGRGSRPGRQLRP